MLNQTSRHKIELMNSKAKYKEGEVARGQEVCGLEHLKKEGGRTEGGPIGGATLAPGAEPGRGKICLPYMSRRSR